jgi:hypothetical protein
MIAVQKTELFKSPIANHQYPLPNIRHQTQITNHQSPITNHKSQITNIHPVLELALPAVILS